MTVPLESNCIVCPADGPEPEAAMVVQPASSGPLFQDLQ